ncbi:MAG: hypothetical protein ACOX39_02925 [Arcobacteraceae bacterium]|nr:hypothetical protein [Arcobacteraceae bacterium]
MRKIKYSGPRPMISQYGIEFKDGKEDKYVYLMISAQILKAIDKDFDKQSHYSYDLSTKRIADDELVNILLSHEQSIEERVEKEASLYEQKLEDEIENIKNLVSVNGIEKEVWIKNLEIMKEYRSQRAINKIYYIYSIKEIIDIIRREKIKVIDVPFYEKYWHVLKSIEGQINRQKSSLRASLKVIQKDGMLKAVLDISGQA